MRFACLIAALAFTVVKAEQPRDYPIHPVPFTETHVLDGFWSPRLDTNRSTTVWYDYQKCEETGRINNFAKAAKLMAGEHKGDPFDDSDVYKVIEGAAYCLALQRDAKLEEYTDKLIDKISAAQEPDGYLYTARTIHPENPPGRASKHRWLNERGALGQGDSHELYNAGHMYEAAVAYFQATGKRKFLEVAIKHADLVDKNFGPGPEQLKIPSGHQEIEIGLVKLFRATGEERYLKLAKFLLDCRGRYLDDPKAKRKPNDYYADHIPVTEQTEAVGHAVRSAYMYSAMADIAALTGDAEYLKAVDKLWDNVVGKKLHLTGGIGANPNGEAFGKNYELPNENAYLETCAAIANALWNHRMFLLHGDAKYIDVLERIIYNGFLSGAGITGNRFFYPNPLESDGQRKFNHGSNERAPWFGCSCCPVNNVRFIPSIPGFIYAIRDNDLFVNLFISSSSKLKLGDTSCKVSQSTEYPWAGTTRIEVSDLSGSGKFALNLRIPGWARNQPVPSDLYTYSDKLQPKVRLAVNGKRTPVSLNKGFAVIDRQWKNGDTVSLELEMPVRTVSAHPEVKVDYQRFALERGPLVYCAEGADNQGQVLEKFFPGKIRFSLIAPGADSLPAVTKIAMQDRDAGGFVCLPYYAWCHRGPNEMRVWFPRTKEVQKPKLASHCWELDSVEACFDGKVPSSSHDNGLPRFTWWDHCGSKEWIMRQFETPRKISRVSVYWFDDTGAGSCRVPAAWKLLYLDGATWKPVANPSSYSTKTDQFNELTFTPVQTTALRLEAELQPEFSAGILEWKCE